MTAKGKGLLAGAWIAAEAAAIVCLLACGGGGSDAGGKATVQFWQFWPAATVDSLVAEFERQNPDIEVDMQQLTWGSGLEKITASVASGRPPDLCELGSTWFAKFAASGALRDLTGHTRDLRDGYLMWDACTYNDKVYAFPWLTGTRALFYNRTLAWDAGLDPDKPPQTWADLAGWVKAMHNPKERVFGWGLNSGERYVQYKKFMPFAWGNGGRVLDDAGKAVFNSPEVLEALEFYLSLKEYALLEKQEVLDQGFRDGRLGATISGAWMLRTLPRDVPDLDFGVTLVPRPEGGRHASFGGGELLAVFEKARHPEAAMRLARFLMASENAMAIARSQQSVLPAAQGAEEDPFFREDPRRAVFLKQLETAVFPPNHPRWVEIEDAVDQALELAVYGRVTPRKALDQGQAAIEGIVESAQ